MNFFDQIKKEVYIISEIGINHNGDLGTALDLIEASKNAGVNAVKFQKRNLEEIYTKKILEDSNSQEWNFDYIIPILKETELSEEDYSVIKKKCEDLNIDLIITPFDLKSAEFCYNLGVKAFKISSADMVNYELIKKCNSYGSPLIISTGMWSQKEIFKAIDYYYDNGIYNFAMLLANSTYPCPYADINLGFLKVLQEQVGYTGYSGHDTGIFIPIGAVALGADIIEKHITLNKQQTGPDHRASLLPSEFKQMVSDIRNLEKSLGVKKTVNQAERLSKEVFAKSAVAIEKINAGTILTKELITYKSPGKGLFQHQIEEYFGKEIKRDIEKEQYICKEDFNNDIPDWKNVKFNFKKDWGIKCRFHDYGEYRDCNIPLVEFHCSEKDVESDFIKGNPKTQLVVHAPELFFGRELVDFCSLDKRILNESLKLIQKTIDKTIEISSRFSLIHKPKVVVHFGGMSLQKGLEKYEYDMLDKAIKWFKKLSYSTELVDILGENMPKMPWFIGGAWQMYAFTKPEHMIYFAENTNTKITFDTSHAGLYCNHSGESLVEYTKKVKHLISHIHFGDAEGLGGEGLQIGTGNIDFKAVLKELEGVDFTWVSEIWQAHLQFSKGAFQALKKLEKLDKRGIL